jgi:hypothetical protein
MSRPKTERCAMRGTSRAAPLVAALLVAAGLAGCSNADLYLDRRDNIAPAAGDALAANSVEQMVDPWPAYSGDKDIAFNGEKMQQAVARYRTGKIIPPADPENFMSTNQSGQTISTTVNNGAGGAAASATTPGQ